jgi:hypothetical protein
MTEKSIVKVTPVAIRLSVSKKKLAEFKKEFDPKNFPDPLTPDGYTFFQKGLSTLVGHRTGTERFRQQAVGPFNAEVKRINGICNGLGDELKLLEAPMREKKKIADDEKDRIRAEKKAEEQRRIAEIHNRLNVIRQSPVDMLGKNPAEIMQEIEDLRMVDPEHDFGEFVDLAIEVCDSTLTKLEELHQHAVDAEEVAKQKAIQDEKDRQDREAKEKLERREREKEEKQIEKDRQELEALRKKEADRLAKEEAEANPEPVVDPEPKTPMQEARDEQATIEAFGESVDHLQEDKETTITAIQNILLKHNIGVSAGVDIASVLFQEIYVDKIPFVKWDNSPEVIDN